MIMESLGPDVLGADVLGADTPDADAPGADTPGADLGTDGDAEPVDDDADARDPGATIPDGSPVQPAPRGRKKRKSRR
jgi:hypothetical protein